MSQDNDILRSDPASQSLEDILNDSELDLSFLWEDETPAEAQSAPLPRKKAAPKAKPPVKAPEKAPQEPAPKKAAPKKASGKKSKKKKASPVITAIFYTFYFLMIGAACLATYMGLQWLHGWLLDFEASQPTVRSQQVFDELFSDPDWANLYRIAGEENTVYEDENTFAAYMAQKVGSRKLDFVETSAGLSGNKKFIVRLDGEKVATFTLVDKNAVDADTPSWQQETNIADWQFDSAEVFYTRREGTTIQLPEGCTAYINDVPLDDSNTIETTYTSIEKYITVNKALNRTNVQTVSGLLMPPVVKVLDESGSEVNLEFDEEANRYTASVASTEQTIPSSLSERVVKAAESYAAFMIRGKEGNQLTSYFDSASNSYKDIIKMNAELWMNSDRGHTFHDETVTQYIRYDDETFSARVHVRMHVICKDNTQKDYTVDTTLFFHLKNGNWLAYEMTNEEISSTVREVRLTFRQDDEILSSELYSDSVSSVQAPVISAPQGKVLSGWMREVRSEDGTISMEVVFTPDETGKIEIPYGAKLEPMVLYPLFEAQ